ncbi:MAG: hydroxymethylbilane synthase [Candidatus Palauibacterales bacterium]|nr:hydroxymethylbilane synthase [Candidatus Palauibacterales bacterium]MDP2529653.1 hydroxymethylbilane synthase [Candidatus Palauibacterales bacterium]MDP2584404.1 hydroxymethylbilane synthase [Candidatus Palauibacterales bacterium]
MRIGARKSELARVQAEWVADALRRAHPDLEVECVWMSTEGDRIQDRPLPEIGGKGLFTARLETALEAGDIHLAVHSLKDLPTELAGGFTLGCVPAREDPRDVLLGPEGPTTPGDLPPEAVVGTSSPRRMAQLRALRPDCRTRAIRGNVGTRIRKMREGRVDALLLAGAGLLRLGLLERSEGGFLEPPAWLPAPGQGALALECRRDDAETLERIADLQDLAARAAVEAERALLATLEGGCQVPVGALARPDGDRGLRLDAIVLAEDGSRWLRASGTAAAEEATELGASVAGELLDRGADRLLSVHASP